MSIESTSDKDGEELVIRIQGRFDFSSHQEFRESYDRSDLSPHNYIIDLTDTTYLDSSALGMLLLLRDHAGGDKSRVRIINCNRDVKKILTISNFEQLFAIQ
ncbi:MAG: STAS domain-containing protein [Pseudohongiella sp.]|nr:MAG: STAS domain-containing protein [Pseudohongiella sp.]